MVGYFQYLEGSDRLDEKKYVNYRKPSHGS